MADYLYGKLNKELELAEYTGKESDTISVEIDNDEHTIKADILDNSITKDKLHSSILTAFSPEMYGAVGDGITDDSSAIEACFQSSSLGTVCIPFGKVYRIGTNISTSGSRFIYGLGTIKIDQDVVFTVNGPNDGSHSAHLEFQNVIGDGIIRFENIKNADIIIGYANNFEIFAGGNESLAYNKFFLGRIKNFKLHSSGNGWINENLFIGGRFMQNFVFGNDTDDTDGTYPHNNNIFNKPCFEGNLSVKINRGFSNIFKEVRCEGSNDFSIEFGPKSYGNHIERSHSNFHSMYYFPTNGSITDLGSNSVQSIGEEYGKVTHFSLNNNSNNYSLDDFYIDVNGVLHTTSSRNECIKTNLIDISSGVGFKIHAKKTSTSTRIVSRFYCYDENKELITTMPVNKPYAQASLSWNDSDPYCYYINPISSVDDLYVCFSKTNNSKDTGIKYVELRMLPTASGEFESIDIDILTSKQNNVEFIVPKTLTKSSMPDGTTMIYPNGTIVYNSNITVDRSGAYTIGWIKTSDGWKALTN